ncbi:uncharacterized protein [Pyxicephalus adspersus]|uniref:uncharacterized protein n=1 Tax=Pyxicephalus adspersus TaxID=30357 RepID=UPI003B5A874C
MGLNIGSYYQAMYILLLLFMRIISTNESHQVKFKIHSDFKNCTLENDDGSFLCYGDCNQDDVQHQTLNNSFVVKLCEKYREDLKVNLKSLERNHSITSGTLQLILGWKLDKFFNATNASIEFIFNGKNLTNEEITNLPNLVVEPQEKHVNMTIDELIKEMEYRVQNLWEHFRSELQHFPEGGETPEATKQLVFVLSIISGIIVGIIIIIACIYLVKKHGEKTCKWIYEKIEKIFYRKASQSESDPTDDPGVMQAPDESMMFLPDKP